ncbi:hypothetical protein QYF36_010619 [Acer negundo]|nr:hypothetical protein QYF36_010619 [Acer negundo]
MKSRVDMCKETYEILIAVKANLDESYVGYGIWLPNAPKVQKPRSVFNAAALAYIGDCIYELYVRRHFLFSALCIEEYNDRVTAVVHCEAQFRESRASKFHTMEEEEEEQFLTCEALAEKK